ncbi:MAG: sigma-70 family RNA polymerase sigma factor [Saprospiraceae bacterium]|nr:sigma-70 family RNA polymerase sigma factor [Saprospiraceae bacterium]
MVLSHRGQCRFDHTSKKNNDTESLENVKILSLPQERDEEKNVKIQEQRHYIKAALKHLSPDDVTMITLFYLKELSLEEIADITQIEINTIKVKLHRARKRMAEVLQSILKGEEKSLFLSLFKINKWINAHIFYESGCFYALILILILASFFEKKHMEAHLEEKIWEVIDGEADEQTRLNHEKLMVENAEYRSYFICCNQLHSQLLDLDLELPSMRFTQNVMEEVLPPLSIVGKKDASAFYFLAAMGVLVAVFSSILIYATVSGKSNTNPQPDNILSFFFNPYILNVFILVNLFALFFLIDTLFLRPFFEGKMKK